MRARARSEFLAIPVMLVVLLLCALPGVAAAATSNDIDLVAGTQIPTNVRVADVGHHVIVHPGVYFYGTGTTAINEVIYDLVAPGGTKLDPDYLPPNCTIIVPDREASCPSTGELWPGQGEGTPFYGWNLWLVLLSTHVTPGRFTAQCACDVNPSNNSTPITITFIDQSPSPTPAGTTPAAPHPTDTPAGAPTNRRATPVARTGTPAAPATTVDPTVAVDPSATSAATASAADVAPVPVRSVGDLPQAAVRAAHGSSTVWIVTVLVAGTFAAGTLAVALLRRRSRPRTPGGVAP